MLTVGSLFSGIGGLELGLERAGMQIKWQVEIEPYAKKIIAQHWPDVTRYGDVRDVGAHNLEPVDLICGGFPCQDVSLATAGKRKGLGGKRSTLWSEFARLISEIRPRWVLAENVPGLLSANDGEFFGTILRNLAEIGYNAEWDCIPAAAFGAPHIRYRMLIVAHPTSVGLEETRPRGMYERTEQYLHKTAGIDERGQWTIEPDMGRVANGIPNRVDRIKCLGNAVVPQVAEYIGRRIVEADRQNHA